VFSLSDRGFFGLAVMIYGLSAVYSIFLWKKGFQHHNRVNYVLMAIGLCFHTVAMIKRGFSFSRCPVNNLYEAITFVAWTIVAAYLALGTWSRLRFLGAFTSPVIFAIGVFALMPALDQHGTKPHFSSSPVSLHAALVLLSYGAFGLSSIAAFMYLMQEHDLKIHKFRAVFSLLPPIQRLETVMSWLMLAGLVLFTAGLCFAPVIMHEKYGVYLNLDAKTLWSVVIWLVYLALIVMRWAFSQRGRRLAWGSVAGFTFLLLTFWGTNLMSSVHQQ
jgi:ABC-type transport system involved in cytochrome c biogenesis permease subunit